MIAKKDSKKSENLRIFFSRLIQRLRTLHKINLLVQKEHKGSRYHLVFLRKKPRFILTMANPTPL